MRCSGSALKPGLADDTASPMDYNHGHAFASQGGPARPESEDLGRLGWWICRPTPRRVAVGCGGRTRTSDHRINNSAFVSGHLRISPFLSMLPRSGLVRTCAKTRELDAP